MNHTPGPFHWEIESQDHRTLTLMAGAPYRTLAYVRFPTYNPTRPNEITSKDKANARFIVQACNSHEELLEALREIDDICMGKLPLTAQIKEIARAAIAKAGG